MKGSQIPIDITYCSSCIIELNSLGFVINTKTNIDILHIFFCKYHIRQKHIFFLVTFFLEAYTIYVDIMLMLTTKLLSDNRHRYICNLICILT